MMKKFIISIVMLLLSCPHIQAGRDGGAIAAGALGGLALGTMIGSATAGQSRREARAEQEAARARHAAIRVEQEAIRAQERAEQEALKAQEKLEQIRIEQGQQRMAQLEREIERRNIENKIAKSRASGNNSMYIFMMGLIIILMFLSIALSVVLFKKRP